MIQHPKSHSFFLIFKFLSDSDLNSVDDSAKILGLAGWRFCSRSALFSASKAVFFFCYNNVAVWFDWSIYVLFWHIN